MKLVELLAKELNEWPEGGSCDYCCQSDSDTQVFFGAPVGSIFLSERADKTEGVTVTRAQWQAERDKQKGGEWKRHRGGRMPVAMASMVEVKLRCGDIQQGESHEFLWRHAGCDVAANIMQYRVISQPQAEEVEVKDTTIGTISYKVEIDTSEADKAIDALTAKWEQFDGPLAWRDTIIHCQAIIEDCEREIERNTQQLADEGLLLIAPITDVRADTPDTDPSDWRQWKAGDELECVFSTCGNIYTVGSVYTVKKTESEYAVVTDDTMSGNGTCHISGEDIADIRFIRRP